MEVKELEIPGLLLIKPKVFSDDRGYFFESFRENRYRELGIPLNFVQDNLSVSKKDVLRGLHYQNPNAQGKLVSVPAGRVYDVVVDLRKGSPSFGKWLGVEISSENRCQLYIPPNFAHGFCVLSDTAVFSYKCTDYYAPQSEHCLLYNDKELGIRWPSTKPIVSAKDLEGTSLSALKGF